jgi:hypothetical protein
MGVVTGTAKHDWQFQQAVSSGLITPETLAAQIVAPAVPGATLNYTNGTNALQVDQLYGKAITLNATNSTIDLTSLPLIDGTTAAGGRVRELILFNPDANAAHLVKLYAGASNGASFLPPVASYLSVPGNNGSVRLSDPNSTGAGNGFYVDNTHKNLVVDTGSNNVTFYLAMGLSSLA